MNRSPAKRPIAAGLTASLIAALVIVYTARVATADLSSTPIAPPTFAVSGIAPAAIALNAAAGVSQQPHPAVARIIVPDRDGTSYGSGTLVDITESQGLVITNWHVVESQAGPITVVFPDGFRSQATVLKHDPTWDLAALSIWKPNVAPVPIAPARAKPGDALAIAGYGSGNYRMAAGRCTQYVAPGPRQPFEMVEVSAAARQGDSGGPILNGRGELAGVLFGEGDGKTAGSDALRVAQFLAPIRGMQSTQLARLTVDRRDGTNSPDAWQAADDSPPAFASNSPDSTTGQQVPADPFANRIAPSNQSPSVPYTPNAAAHQAAGGWSWPIAAPQPNAPISSPPTSSPAANATAQLPTVDGRPSYPPPASTATPAIPPAASADESAAGQKIQNLLGDTRFEQAKSILAIIGIIAIVVTFSKAFAKS
ncbi:MAG: trypsin-like peptidase domain-containing protein [Pirellulales bacterium]